MNKRMGEMDWQAILDGVAAGVQLCSCAEGMPVLYCSEGFTRLTGYTPQQLEEELGGMHAQLIVEKDREKINYEVRRGFKSTGGCDLTYRIRRRDGSVLWVRDQGILTRLPSGEEVMQFLLTDITAQRRTEEALRISEKRHEIAMRISDVTMFDYDIRTHRMIPHPKDVEKFGFPPIVENCPQSIIENGVIEPESSAAFADLYRKIANGEPHAQIVLYARDKDGRQHMVQLSLTNIYDDNGKPAQAVGIKKDLSALNQLSIEQEYGSVLLAENIFLCEGNVHKDLVLSQNRDCLSNKISTLSEFAMLSRNISVNIPAEHKRRIYRSLNPTSLLHSYQEGQRRVVVKYQRCPTGQEEYLWRELTANMILDKRSGDIIVRIYDKNIHESYTQELHEVEQRRAYESMTARADAVFEVDLTQNTFKRGHEAWGQQYGFPQSDHYEEMLANYSTICVHPEDLVAHRSWSNRQGLLTLFSKGGRESSLEFRCLDTGNEAQFQWVRTTFYLFDSPTDGHIIALVCQNKIQEEKQRQLEILYKSQHDTLTGFYNRATMVEKINECITNPLTSENCHALLVIDIDHFKGINDNFGHAFGDAVLSKFAQRLRIMLRGDDILGRVGGDEFVVFLKNLPSPQTACDKAEDLCRNLVESYSLNGKSYPVSVSVGIAVYNTHGNCYEALYLRSDAALYCAKNNGRSQYALFRAEMDCVSPKVVPEQPHRLFGSKSMAENVSEFVLRILHESRDAAGSIQAVLELVGKLYACNRVCIYEQGQQEQQGQVCALSWQTEGVPSPADISASDWAVQRLAFDEDGLCLTEPQSCEMGEPCSMAQFLLLRYGVAWGFISFEHWSTPKSYSREELLNFRSVADLLSLSLAKLRLEERVEQQEKRMRL